MSVSPELMARYDTERWTPLPETTAQQIAAAKVEHLLDAAIHLLAEALNERNPR